MNKLKARKLALALLDDSYGIGIDAYTQLQQLCTETDNDDVIGKAVSFKDRFILQEDDAEELWKSLDNTENVEQKA